MGKEVVFDLHPGEKVVSVSRKHWFSFLGNIVVILVLIILFLVVVFLGNAAISNVSYEKIFNILMDYTWLFWDIILSALALALLLYLAVIFGKKYFDSIAFKDILDVFNRHRFAFVAGYALFIIVVLLFAIIIVINTQLHFSSIAAGNTSNEISQNIGKGLLTVFSGMYALTILGYFYVSWLDFYMDVFIITSRRIIRIEQVIIFSRKTSETSFQHIQDASSHVRGFIYSLLDIGGIFVETAGEHENFTFSPVSHPNELATTILKLQRLGWIDEGVKDQFSHNRIVEEGMKLVEDEVKEQIPIIEKVILAKEEEREKQKAKKYYNDGRVVVEEGVIWQAEQELTDEVLKALNNLDEENFN